MNKKIFVCLCTVPFLLSGCNANASTQEETNPGPAKNLRQVITELYCDYAIKRLDYDKSELSEEEYNQEKEAIHKRYIDSYLGNKGDVYAVSFDFNGNPSAWNGGSNHLKVGDYISKAEYYFLCPPLIYYQQHLYNLDMSLSKGIIDLDFIKTFDDFQKIHSVQELEEIYLWKG